jgi:N-terminal domain of reverse transcriptase
MTEKRTPVAERRRETTTGCQSSLLVVVDNRPDTGPGARRRERADAVRCACEEKDDVIPEPEDKLDTMVVSGPEDATLDWRQVDWRRAEQNVRRLRQRIFTASKAGDLSRVRRLQALMLRSRSNTLVSVRRVTERNAGRLTAGVDGEVVLTPKAKTELVLRVQDSREPFKALPVRRVFIPKPGGKKEAAARDPDGHRILLRRPTSFWVRWWSRIRSIRWLGCGSRCCMCVVKLPAGCMCATVAAGGT